jgi:hypothetical protein
MRWLPAILFFLAGTAFGLFVGRMNALELSYNLRVADIINWVVVVGLATLLKLHWQRKYSDVRVEKDLLIEQSKDAISALKDARNAFLGCCDKKKISREDQIVIEQVLRRLANALSCLECSLAECERMSSLSVEPATDHYLKYKACVTGGAFPSKPYTVQTSTEQEILYRALLRDLQRLVFTINKA